MDRCECKEEEIEGKLRLPGIGKVAARGELICELKISAKRAQEAELRKPGYIRTRKQSSHSWPPYEFRRQSVPTYNNTLVTVQHLKGRGAAFGLDDDGQPLE